MADQDQRNAQRALRSGQPRVQLVRLLLAYHGAEPACQAGQIGQFRRARKQRKRCFATLGKEPASQGGCWGAQFHGINSSMRF
jgi:hypothetical protein